MRENQLDDLNEDDWVEPATTQITGVLGDKANENPGPSAAYYQSGGDAVLISLSSNWTKPAMFSEKVHQEIERAAKQIVNEDEPVPEAAIELLKKYADLARKSGEVYARCEANLHIGYRRLYRYEESFRVANALADSEPSLILTAEERKIAYLNLGTAAFELYCSQSVKKHELLLLSGESYARVDKLAHGENIGALASWTRVEIELGNLDKAAELWQRALAEGATAPGSIQRILNKDAVLYDFNKRCSQLKETLK